MLSGDVSFTSSSDSEAAGKDVEYDRVEVSSNARWDDDEPDANDPLADENWLAQYEAERQKKQERKLHQSNHAGLGIVGKVLFCFTIWE